MEEVKIKVTETGVFCSKGFLTVSTNRDLAPSLEKFWDVLAATEPFAPKSITMLMYNVNSLTVYVFGVDIILASKTFPEPPTEKQMDVALFGLLLEIIREEEEE